MCSSKCNSAELLGSDIYRGLSGDDAKEEKARFSGPGVSCREICTFILQVCDEYPVRHKFQVPNPMIQFEVER